MVRVVNRGDAVAAWLRQRRPEVALVLGSGLGHLTDELQSPLRLGYERIPDFPGTAVEGHAGEFVAGELAGRTVLCQSGRFHGYEGHSPDTVALPVRLFAELGIATVILTNAAGGIRFGAGTLMLLADHLNLSFGNPLIGPRRPDESRFPDMSSPYDRGLRQLAREAAASAGIALAEGVYAGVTGPSYETPAEIRMLRGLGADAVGMSTVQEVVAARALGLRCLGFSVITNQAAGLSPRRLEHAEVMTVAAAAGAALGRVVRGTLERLGGP